MGRNTNTRTYVEIDGREYLLGEDRDLVEVMSRIEEAARSEPAFVDLSDGDRFVSVLVSPRSRVVVGVRNGAPVRPEQVPPTSPIGDWDL